MKKEKLSLLLIIYFHPILLFFRKFEFVLSSIYYPAIAWLNFKILSLSRNRNICIFFCSALASDSNSNDEDFHKNHKIYFYSIFTRWYNAKIFELIDRDSEIFNDVDLYVYVYYYQWKKQNPWGFTHTHALARPQFFHSHF